MRETDPPPLLNRYGIIEHFRPAGENENTGVVG